MYRLTLKIQNIIYIYKQQSLTEIIRKIPLPFHRYDRILLFGPQNKYSHAIMNQQYSLIYRLYIRSEGPKQLHDDRISIAGSPYESYPSVLEEGERKGESYYYSTVGQLLQLDTQHVQIKSELGTYLS